MSTAHTSFLLPSPQWLLHSEWELKINVGSSRWPLLNAWCCLPSPEQKSTRTEQDGAAGTKHNGSTMDASGKARTALLCTNRSRGRNYTYDRLSVGCPGGSPVCQTCCTVAQRGQGITTPCSDGNIPTSRQNLASLNLSNSLQCCPTQLACFAGNTDFESTQIVPAVTRTGLSCSKKNLKAFKYTLSCLSRP